MLSEWYHNKSDAGLTGHRSAFSLAHLNHSGGDMMSLGGAFARMKRSHIDGVMSFRIDGAGLLCRRADEAWNHITESGLHFGKWTSLMQTSIIGKQSVTLGFEKEASAIMFKMVWPELVIRRNA